MDLDLTSGKLWISILVGAAVLAAVSAGFQKAQGNDDELNIKGVIRDGILGGIFVAMAWTFIPESMSTLSDSVSTAATKVSVPISRGGGGPDIEVQFGPARF